jgi:type II secretory pathway pseudopilin PulG
LVVGLLIGSLLVPLSTQVDQRNAADTQRRLEDAREALFGFAVANGRFPCPAAPSTSGQESFCTTTSGGCTSTNTVQSHGRCSNFYNGYLPGQALGLNNLDSSGYALDAYPLSQGDQGRLRYAIADLTIGTGPGVPHGLTASPIAGISVMRSANLLGVTSTPYLVVCSTWVGANSSSCQTTNVTVAQNVAFIVYSLGKNGSNVTPSSDENWNLNASGLNRTFISRSYSGATGTGAFDDQLLWVSNYALISRMVVAGALP